MSSSTRSRPDPPAVRLAAAVLVLCPALPAGPTAVPLADATVLPVVDSRVCVVVDVERGSTQPVPPDAVSVSVGGVRQPVAVVPVMSDGLTVGIVVDASKAGAAGTGPWQSGAARFVLEAPAGARTAVVADTTPPAVLATLQPGPTDPVRALSAVQPHGTRDTSAALALAVRQLPADRTAPRVVILYTGAPDAGGEASGALAARLAAEHVLLVVVSTATDSGYWSGVTRPTGGFLAPAVTSAVTPALDQVATSLRARYLVSFPAPARLPVDASVRVDLKDVTMSADVVVPRATATGTSGARDPASRHPWVPVAVLATAIVVATVLLVGAALRLVGAMVRRT